MENIDMITYGQEVKWTKLNGHVERISVTGCQTLKDAQEKAFAWALDLGWTPPKWWQFWRCGDTRLPPTYSSPPAPHYARAPVPTQSASTCPQTPDRD